MRFRLKIPGAIKVTALTHMAAADASKYVHPTEM
jgi:hypothetical protein